MDGKDSCVAELGGQNSGKSDCLMRYHSAHFYRRNDGKLYIYPDDDEVGDSFCQNDTGTGYNAKKYWERTITKEKYGKTYTFKQVFPMCGDATLGDCKHQIHVSDKHD